MELNRTKTLKSMLWVVTENDRDLIKSLADENNAQQMDLIRYMVINFTEKEEWKQKLLEKLYTAKSARINVQ